jgi:rhodanese-related sulfurtransferase
LECFGLGSLVKPKGTNDLFINGNWLLVVILAVWTFVGIKSGSGQEPNFADSVDVVERNYLRSEATGNNCGLYAAAAAIKAAGGEVELQDLMKSQFISHNEGSSAEDLVRLIEANGFNATVIDRLNGSSLWLSSYPILIHLDGSRRIEGSHHWITFLGLKNQKPIIFDPPNPAEIVEYGDIFAFSSGLGIVVSPKPAVSYLYWADKLELTAWMVLIVFCLWTAAFFRKFVWFGHSVIFQLSSLATIALLVVAAQQILPWSSILRDWVSLGHYREIYQPVRELGSLNIEQLRAKLDANEINLVDARLPEAYGFGHLPGAVNWPIDASSIEARKAMRQLNPAKPVAVYCQSENCSWGEMIGSRLGMRGIADVYVFKGGWQEWQQKFPSLSKRETLPEVRQ